MTMGFADMKTKAPTARSQGGHFLPVVSEKENGRELFKAVRLARLEGFRIFAKVLGEELGRHISKPYAIALEQGKRPVTADIERALWRLAAKHDSSDPDVIHARAVSIRTTHRIAEGALISADSKPCARPGCQESFVPSNPFQKYHSPYCREQYKKERKP